MLSSAGFAVFFFQAEDGIRDHCVTGVQTCALPIWRRRRGGLALFFDARQQRVDALMETGGQHRLGCEDRKSTRLNSSHTVISYAVFCLKKKKKKYKY